MKHFLLFYMAIFLLFNAQADCRGHSILGGFKRMLAERRNYREVLSNFQTGQKEVKEAVKIANLARRKPKALSRYLGKKMDEGLVYAGRNMNPDDFSREVFRTMAKELAEMKAAKNIEIDDYFQFNVRLSLLLTTAEDIAKIPAEETSSFFKNFLKVWQGKSWRTAEEFKQVLKTETLELFIFTKNLNNLRMKWPKVSSYFPIGRDIGIVPINILISKRIHIFGLKKNPGAADGFKFAGFDFTIHDIVHANNFEIWFEAVKNENVDLYGKIQSFLTRFEWNQYFLTLKNKVKLHFSFFQVFHEYPKLMKYLGRDKREFVNEYIKLALSTKTRENCLEHIPLQILEQGNEAIEKYIKSTGEFFYDYFVKKT